ncbi:MAG: TetR/AcrR family transcriptional regulator [Muribaculaceae bacterium]|nr:TetR/AcrR family transcriptional regulator [Muribaculaceae bacterium]
MKKEDLTEEQYTKILEEFINSLTKNGLKATTMDGVASSLQMSKRTLYELFGSKEEMFREAHQYFNKKLATNLASIFDSSSNIMEAIIKCFLLIRDVMSRVNVDFIRDMEEYAIKGSLISENHRRQNYQNFYDILEKGVREGYFRNDVNLNIQCRMFAIQMETLKRGEGLFPDDISLLEIYDNVIMGFLRAISSTKGLNELEKYLPSHATLSNHFEINNEN